MWSWFHVQQGGFDWNFSLSIVQFGICFRFRFLVSTWLCFLVHLNHFGFLFMWRLFAAHWEASLIPNQKSRAHVGVSDARSGSCDAGSGIMS